MPASVRILRSSSSAARAIPTAIAATIGLVLSKVSMTPAKPFSTLISGLPSRLSLGMRAFSNRSTRGVRSFDAELVLEALDRDAGVLARNDERLDRRAAHGLVQRRPHHDVGGARAGGDEDLLAVDHVLIAVERGGGRDRGRVGAEARLGDRHRGPHLAEPLELLVGRDAGDRRVAQPLEAGSTAPARRRPS